MRNGVAKTIAAFFAVAALSSTVVAQTQPQQPVKQFPTGFVQQADEYVAAGIPKMPDPPGPAPKRDLTGAWAGPIKASRDPMPAMTPVGEARFKLNKPESVVRLAATNDPFATCDPLGFPRDLLNHAIESRGGMWFEPVANRMIILKQHQRVWREVWMDGRELPKDVDARGYPDSRFYGMSVGHWDGDYTFVINTTGLDERTWLDEAGHPHSKNAHIEERYTRLDQYTIQLTATLDDPKFYSKPWVFLKANYYWMKAQEFQEVFCVPSEAIEYRDTLALPAGTGDEAAK
jgi:hypothetical protein